MTKITINLAETVLSVFQPLLNTAYRYLNLVGGAGSGKSWFAAQQTLARALEGVRCLIIRKVSRSHRLTTYQTLQAVARQWGLYDQLEWTPSYLGVGLPQGSIDFVGLDQVDKLKSLQGVNHIWIEEASEVSSSDLEQLDLRLRGKGPHKQIVLTYNPVASAAWIGARFENEKRAYTHWSTYRNNPHLDQPYIEQLENLAQRNPNWGIIYKLGQWGGLEGVILPKPLVVPFPSTPGRAVVGLDWGFNNPAAAAAVWEEDDVTYARELLYTTHLTTADIYEYLKPWKTHLIRADSAEPSRIEEGKRLGFRVEGAIKGPGSLVSGLSHMQGLTWALEGENLLREWSLYSWKLGPDGKPLETPAANQEDHLIDSIRYAVYIPDESGWAIIG